MNAFSTVEPPRENALRPRDPREPSALTGWVAADGSPRLHDFTMVNLSYSGCRIRTEAPLRRGEAVKLVVQQRGAIHARVHWHSGRDFGLSFDASQPAAPLTERKAPRTQINLPVLARRSGRSAQSLEALDVSPLGCRLCFVDVPRVGDLLWIKLPGVTAVESEVRWVRDHQAGMYFKTPIHPAVFGLVLSGLSA
ncbi:PilZ domain-containing protein [Sphingomonas sp. KRR8]|uniref:PilZ domain-containing protein n=1 Tax=Sphingomonas sp. KRR8 TaxID=2942996 RepID=UPI0020205495|nr:PilZ domain-containing protein [Sphingomonas sp. KRR8]URD61394.1 PilZ domain-containing protein [Sphingomonas sp. KRR8]